MKNRQHPGQLRHLRDDSLAVAKRLHSDGDLDGASNRYRKILRKQPRHPEALHLLGLIANQRGDNAAALELMQQSIRIRPDEPYYYNNLGLVQFALGMCADAETSYHQALGLNPDLAPVHANLANALRARGKPDEAVRHYQEALRIQPDLVGAACLAGDVLREQQQFRQALEYYQYAIARNPAMSTAHVGAGHALTVLRRYAEARQAFGKALEFDSSSVEAHVGMGQCSLCLQDAAQTVTSYRAAIRLAPDNLPVIQSYISALQFVNFTGKDKELECDLIQMLDTDGVEHQGLVACASAVLLEREDIRSLLDSKLICSPKFAPEYGDTLELLVPLTHPLLLLLLNRALLTSPEFERLLTSVRRALLHAPADVLGVLERDIPLLRFLCALARQCFINDYVYDVTDAEHALLVRLKSGIMDELGKGGQLPVARVALLAAYEPLYRWPDSKAVDAGRLSAADETFRELTRQQLADPLREKAIAREIPQITAISDEVSVAVRDQYEESPYPRWEHIPYQLPAGLQICVAQALPTMQEVPVLKASRPDILVAGCGTGRHAIMTALRVMKSNVLAVDLSRSSLAYAIRKAHELDVSNIRFAQADILALDQRGQRYDLIECAGVLHHMYDPLLGWRVLAGLLKPGGLMRIALYSDIARRNVVEARKLVEQGRYGTSREEIRSFRQVLYALPATEAASRVISQFRDFYNTAECRDLLFHVQEHRFTLPEVGAAIQGLGLEFMGLEIHDQRVLQRYLERFPDDPQASSLANWDRYEHEHPETFLSMYIFWVARR